MRQIYLLTRFALVVLVIVGCGTPKDRARSYFDSACESHQAKDYEGAIADYTEAIELDPSFASAYTYRGTAWEEQGDKEKALADYSKAIELDPDIEDVQTRYAYEKRAAIYREKGEDEKAEADESVLKEKGK